MAELAFRAPLCGLLHAGRHGRAEGTPGLRIADRNPAAAAVARRAGSDATANLPQRPGCVVSGTEEFIWTGPGQWLALDPARSGLARFGFAAALAERFGSVAVTDLTGARAILRLTGPAVRDTLMKLVPIDLDDTAFPPGSAAVTLAGHVGVTLWRPTPEAWDIACFRSFGGSLLHDVMEAAAEFGCEVAAG